MKRIFLSLSLMLTICAVYASSALIVTPVSGEAVRFVFEQEPEVSFVGSKLHVKTNDASNKAEFEIDNVASLSFDNSSDVSAATPGSGIVCSHRGDAVVFSNIPEPTAAAVYTVDGKMVLSGVANETLTLDRSRLGAGLYIVRIGAFTAKVKL
ncbi:MAG: T9SS type A sorting domain-containing protein [Muribaculaceae bacterium]|nr:T9SS type A sorting domain-containing protein [Muribaculaceae bacterium]